MPEDREASEEGSQLSIALQLQSLMQPEIHSYISKLKARYNRYAMPLEEGRKLIDQAMGKTTLTELLYQMRQETV
jgi:hypothetical protein